MGVGGLLGGPRVLKIGIVWFSGLTRNPEPQTLNPKLGSKGPSKTPHENPASVLPGCA